MYELSLTRQALPSRSYRLLLGTALCVFNSNNAFIIENILRTDPELSWYKLIDLESGRLLPYVEKTIAERSSLPIRDLFSDLVQMRNRIIHGFQITNKQGEQSLATKEHNSGRQFEITEEYLKAFINKNQQLSDLLYEYRSQWRETDDGADS